MPQTPSTQLISLGFGSSLILRASLITGYKPPDVYVLMRERRRENGMGVSFLPASLKPAVRDFYLSHWLSSNFGH